MGYNVPTGTCNIRHGEQFSQPCENEFAHWSHTLFYFKPRWSMVVLSQPLGEFAPPPPSFLERLGGGELSLFLHPALAFLIKNGACAIVHVAS